MSTPDEQPPIDPPPPYSPSEADPPSEKNTHAETPSTSCTPPLEPTPLAAPAPAVLMAINYGPEPMGITCPYCSAAIVTRTEYEVGVFTYLASGLIALFCFWGPCLIPCFLNGCKDVYHYCPSCQNFLGAYKRLQL